MGPPVRLPFIGPIKPKAKYAGPNKPATVKTNLAGGFCSCVSFSRAVTGFNQTVGFARNWPRNSIDPVVGGVLIENISKAGHVSVITGFTDAGIVVKEANYRRCSLTSGRIIPYNSPTIIGFWKS